MSHSSVTLICFTSLAACSRLLPAQDLSLIRAATQQRMSLLRTLDAEFRVWEDADARMGFDGPAADADNVCRIRWITDRGRVLLEVSQGGFTNRLVYDGEQTIRLIADPQDPSKTKWAFIDRAPPDLDVMGPTLLPYLLGTSDAFLAGDVETLLSADDIRSESGWTFPGANCDVVFACTARTTSMPTVHLGFNADRGWALAVRHYGSSRNKYSAAVVDEWMTVRSELTGEELSVPERGHSVMRSVSRDGTIYHQVFRVEVDRFELLQAIPLDRFAATIAPGTEVWEESDLPGQPARRSIAGGAAAIEREARNAAIQTEAAMAQLRGSGTIFNGRPQPRNWTWLFLLTGCVLVGGGLLWRRREFRKSNH